MSTSNTRLPASTEQQNFAQRKMAPSIWSSLGKVRRALKLTDAHVGSLDEESPWHSLWNHARRVDNSQGTLSLTKTRDGIEWLECPGVTYTAIHIRREYRQVLEDITDLYDYGTRDFDTPPDDTDEDAMMNAAAASNGIEDIVVVDESAVAGKYLACGRRAQVISKQVQTSSSQP